MIYLRHNLAKVGNHSIIGHGIKSHPVHHLTMQKPIHQLSHSMSSMNIGSGLVFDKTQTKRKPINFL